LQGLGSSEVPSPWLSPAEDDLDVVTTTDGAEQLRSRIGFSMPTTPRHDLYLHLGLVLERGPSQCPEIVLALWSTKL
jgi:hypothetical protein